MNFTLDDILHKVDKMEIHERDYDTIKMLLKNTDEELFTKILEEVLLGNLYWSDFERYLANTNYPKLLRESIKSQMEMNSELSKLKALRMSIIDGEGDADKQNIAIKSGVLYDDEFSLFKDKIIYELTKIDKNDTALTIVYKYKLYNAIKNNELLNTLSTNSNSEISNNKIYVYQEFEGEPTSGVAYYEKKGPKRFEIYGNESSGTRYTRTEYDYLNPDDILFLIDEYLLPLDMKYQVLDDFDYNYMEEHNLTPETMQQIKSVSLIFRENNLFDPLKK